MRTALCARPAPLPHARTMGTRDLGLDAAAPPKHGCSFRPVPPACPSRTPPASSPSSLLQAMKVNGSPGLTVAWQAQAGPELHHRSCPSGMGLAGWWDGLGWTGLNSNLQILSFRFLSVPARGGEGGGLPSGLSSGPPIRPICDALPTGTRTSRCDGHPVCSRAGRTGARPALPPQPPTPHTHTPPHPQPRSQEVTHPGFRCRLWNLP